MYMYKNIIEQMFNALDMKLEGADIERVLDYIYQLCYELDINKRCGIYNLLIWLGNGLTIEKIINKRHPDLIINHNVLDLNYDFRLFLKVTSN